MVLLCDDVAFPADPTARGAVWQAHLAPVFDVDFGNHSRFDRPMRLKTYKAADMLLGTSEGPAERSVRDRRKIARQGVDHVFLQIFRSGAGTVAGARGAATVAPANMFVADFSQPLTIECGAVTATNIVLPRALMQERLPSVEALHATVVDLAATPLGALLSDTLLAMINALPAATPEQMPDLTRATASLVSALLPRAETDDRERAQHLKLAIRRYVETNLGARDMSVEAVAARFACSRSKLQRLFEPEGGFARHVSERRLEHAYRRLVQRGSRGQPDISLLAFETGFKDLSAFSNAFKRRYGIAPSIAAKSASAATAADDTVLGDWIRALA